MESWQIELIDKHERSGHLGILRNLVKSHALSFFWYDDDAPVGSSILHNGTISFVNTGDAILGITANHVYEQYLKDRAINPHLKCQIGSTTAEPDHYLISRDHKLDIAVFGFPSILVTASGVTVHSAVGWPPEILRESELAILGGYPGNRRVERIGTVNFDFVSFIPQVHQHSDDHLAISLNLRESYWPQGTSLGDKPDLGGISGGPVFRIVNEPIERIELAAVIYEASRELEIIRARQMSCITSKGVIQP